MRGSPPFPISRLGLLVLACLVEEFRDHSALQRLWWQASVSPDGVNEHLTRPT